MVSRNFRFENLNVILGFLLGFIIFVFLALSTYILVEGFNPFIYLQIMIAVLPAFLIGYLLGHFVGKPDSTITKFLTTREFGCATRAGRGKNNNEDSIFVAKISKTSFIDDREAFIVIVADGVGGNKAGNIASNNCINNVAKSVMNAIMKEPGTATHSEKDVLEEAIANSNSIVNEKSSNDPALEGMATTISAAIIYHSHLSIASVGNSRSYLFRNSSLSRLTKDHTMVQDLIDAGEITPEQARSHPRRNVITRAIGTNNEVEIDTYEYNLLPNDIIIMCTDGLSDYVDELTIQRLITANKETPQHACLKLIELAISNGSTDDVSVVIIPARFISN